MIWGLALVRGDSGAVRTHMKSVFRPLSWADAGGGVSGNYVLLREWWSERRIQPR